MFKNLKDNVQDYVDELKDYNTPEARQGLVLAIICALLFFVPVLAMNHYNKIANQYKAAVVRNNNETALLSKKTDSKIRYAKIQKKNQPETQKSVEDQVNKVIKAQKTLIAYQNRENISDAQKNEANKYMQSVIENDALTPTQDLLLLAPVYYGHASKLDISVGYTPAYSIYQKSIHVTFLAEYQGEKGKYPIFVTNATYNLQDHKFSNFDMYMTKWTTDYMRAPKLIDKGVIGWDTNSVPKTKKLSKKQRSKIIAWTKKQMDSQAEAAKKNAERRGTLRKNGKLVKKYAKNANKNQKKSNAKKGAK